MVRIFADSNRAVMRYAKELDSAWGTTPASGITRQLRFTASTLNVQKTTTTSDEIVPDRMVSDVIETSAKTSGEINVEFSAGSHDDLMEGFSYGFWTREMTFDCVKGASLAWTADNTITIYGQDVHQYYLTGQRIRTAGFVNPANNDNWQLSGNATYTGGNTVLTTVATTGVIEQGGIKAALYDASDIIVLKSTAIRLGTSGASTIDSNSGNAFAAAISAGQLNVGQNIYIDGLGYDVGTVTLANNTPVSASTLNISDGTNTIMLQFGGALVAGNIAVATGGSAGATAVLIAAAINAARVAGLINVSAKVATSVVTIMNMNGTGGAITATGDSDSTFTIVAFTGGNKAEHGIFTITSLASDVLGVTPQPPTNANAGSAAVTIKGSMLRNPSVGTEITPHSFSFETGFEDVGQYFLANGQRIGQFTLDVVSNAIIKGNFSVQGQGMTRSTATQLGDGSYTVLAPQTTQIANATVDVGTVLLNSAALTTALQSISLTGTNNLRDQMAIANKFPAGIGSGRIEITGKAVAYFADGTLWDMFLNHTFFALSFPISDADNNEYIWTLPSIVFDTDTVNPGGRDQDIMENLTFTARKDPATLCTFQIDRFSNTSPVSAF